MSVVEIDGRKFRIVPDLSSNRCEHCDYYHECDITIYMKCIAASSIPHHLELNDLMDIARSYFNK